MARIDWSNQLVSFVLVVASILLAFQLDKCGTRAKEQELVKAHLAEIVEETQFNSDYMENVIENLENSVEKLDTLLRQIHFIQDTNTINRLIFELLNINRAYIKRTAYQSFVSTGDIRYIRDFEQKSEIVSLYEYHNYASGIGDILLENYNDNFWGYIRRNLDLYQARPQPIALYQNREFINSISSYSYFANSCLNVYRTHLKRMRDFIDRFDAYQS